MFKHKFFIFLLFAFPGLLAGGCATLPKEPVGAYREAYLKDICVRNDIRWQWDHVAQVATLRHKGAGAEVLVGSDLVLVGGERVALSAPVRMVRSAVMVPPDFQSKVIDRLLREAGRQKGYAAPKIREIIIDAGHGGKDPGAIGRTGTQEKKIVLDIAKRLRRILQGRGFSVRMTRDGDRFISLPERTEIASRAGADLFISVHANSNPSRGVHGLEVYTAGDSGFMDGDEAQRRTNRRLMFRNLSMKNGDSQVERIVSDMLHTHKQGEGKVLAGRLARQTARVAKTRNRGVKDARFYVLRNTLVPAVLVEVGFLTNPREEKLLRSGAYRQRIARGLAEGILDYANGR